MFEPPPLGRLRSLLVLAIMIFVAVCGYVSARLWAIALGRRASVRTLIVLGVASILMVAALLIAHYETELTRYLIALRSK